MTNELTQDAEGSETIEKPAVDNTGSTDTTTAVDTAATTPASEAAPAASDTSATPAATAPAGESPSQAPTSAAPAPSWESYDTTTSGEMDFGASLQQFEQEQKEYCFVSGPFTVEPHWSITARRFPFNIDYPALWTRARKVEFNNSKLLTFAPEDMLLVLCVCGSKGKWHRAQMVADVAEAVRRWPDLDWNTCFDRAQSSGSTRMLRLGLHLAHTLLAAPLPHHVIEHIGEDRGVPAIAAKVTKCYSEKPKPNAWTRQGAHIFSPLLFSLRDTRRDKLQYLLRTITTPLTIHQQRFRLGKSMSWAYRVLVPFHDYVLGPAWHVLRQRGGRSRERS